MSRENRKSQKQLRQEKIRARKARQQWVGIGVLALILIAAAFWNTSRPKTQPLDEIRLASDPTVVLVDCRAH